MADLDLDHLFVDDGLDREHPTETGRDEWWCSVCQRDDVPFRQLDPFYWDCGDQVCTDCVATT